MSSNRLLSEETPDAPEAPSPHLPRRRVERSTERDGLRNRLELAVLTRGRRLWSAVQSVKWMRAQVNRRLIDRAASKMPPRPAPFSTRGDFTSWDSLTDRRYDARHLGPVVREPTGLPPVERVVELFERPSPAMPEEDLCQKSTVLFAYFAQWFTDGFLRSDRPPPGKSPDPRRNNSTHEIDLCQIYGLTPEATGELRAHEGGLLAFQGDGAEIFPPLLYGSDGKKRFPSITVARESSFDRSELPYLLAIGTDTGNTQIGHVMMNTLFLREHNRLAAQLEQAYGWSDERLFQTARNINIVMLIKIVIEDYINHITPYHFRLSLDEQTKAYARATWMRPNRMASEFNLLYRWHSLIPSQLLAGGRLRPLGETVLKPRFVLEHGLGPLLEEASRQRAGRVGLFNTAAELLGAERASIQKGRDVQLAPYNDYRAFCGFPRVTSFDQISGDPRVREGLKSRYGTPDDVEFYVGLFAEDPRPNSVLPSLIGRMVGVDAFSQALTNPLLAPRVYSPETFSPLGWREIQRTKTLSDIVNRNVTVGDRPYEVRMTRSGWTRR